MVFYGASDCIGEKAQHIDCMIKNAGGCFRGRASIKRDSATSVTG
ncbi:hypothetical protein PF003_g40466 [Phytophthora fragariae]|nr:hypothetical protein PF003_g40466 [Phytophthora fragariae]